MCYQVNEVHPMSIESQDMISTLLLAFGYPLYREETRAEKWPLG